MSLVVSGGSITLKATRETVTQQVCR